MPCRRIAIALLVLSCLPMIAFAQSQTQAPSGYLFINSDKAFTWSDGPSNVVQLEGHVTINTDSATLTSERAVLWLTPVPGTVLDRQQVEITLLGNAMLQQQSIVRSGETLTVTLEVRGSIRLTAGQRLTQNQSDTDLFRDASAMRSLNNLPPGATPPRTEWIVQHPWLMPAATTLPTSYPSTKPAEQSSFRFDNADTFMTPEGTVAALLTGNVAIVYIKANGDIMELQAQRMVLFTALTSLREFNAVQKLQKIESVVQAAYLEGDAQINFSPGQAGKAESRLRAERIYYDLATDQAVLTNAIIHTVEPQTETPVIIRANFVRQLSKGEYKSEGVELTTSSFAVPSYSIKSSRAYIREYDTGDPRLGMRVDYTAQNNTFDLFHVPVFYWPYAAGSMTERGMPLRGLLFGSSRGFGPGIRSDWGFFESIGKPPPQDLDISYRLDYFSDRGPAGGVDAQYGGDLATETTKQPWDFAGDFTSYFVQDHGEDRFGAERKHVEPETDERYRVLWEHQHFFPEDWQIQLRAGIVSDPTFMEQWFKNDYNNGLPQDLEAYIKHQEQTEAFTLGFNYQPRHFVTTADQAQEQFEVEHIPEVGYYRIGDSLADDQLTFFSANTVDGLHFKQSDYTLSELGFRKGDTPGLPSEGLTGVTNDTVYRGDFRQEVDYPFDAGQFRVVPYVMGRYTAYSDSPSDGTIDRLFAGTGVRMSTAFWKVDNTAYNDLFDIHRIRHVIEPELNLFTSAETKDRDDVFIYDESTDAINDITGAQLALHQRWQTKRGGAGQWRSVDFFTLNIEGNFFANQPNDRDLNPKGFRGLFFPSVPEESIPRNSINADALWRISDSTALFWDEEFNLDEMSLATTSIGLAVQRSSHLSYFVGTRYIGQINTTIASFGFNYQLTPKYTIQVADSVAYGGQRQASTSTVTLIRNFDRFFLTITANYDPIDDTTGVNFGIFPTGLGYGLNTTQLQQTLNQQQ